MPIPGQPDFYPQTPPDAPAPNPKRPWQPIDAAVADSAVGPPVATVQVSRVIDGVPTAVTINQADYNPAVDTLWGA